jgi:hypothetical protein
LGLESGGQAQRRREKKNRCISDMLSRSHSPPASISPYTPPFSLSPPPDLLPDGRAWLETSRGSSLFFFVRIFVVAACWDYYVFISFYSFLFFVSL